MYNYIINKLCKNGFEAYLVGGAVRDLFLNSNADDFDVTTNADPDDICEIFKDDHVQADVGKSSRVCIVNGIEISGYRKDIYYGLSDKNCEVKPAKTIHEDLARRDLTINSMAFCPYSGDLIDPYNGLSDLYNGQIAFTGDPKMRIYEDPNRMVRACRFVAKLDGEFEYDTLHDLRDYSHLIKYVSGERIRTEIFKALKVQNASLFFASLASTNLLQYIFPEMVKCINHTGGSHHKETVFDHLMIVGDSISCKFPILKLAGYLHDIAKATTYNPDEGNFLSHEKEGEQITYQNLRDLKFSNYETAKIGSLVRCHMYSIKTDVKIKTVRRILSKLENQNVEINEFLRLKIADRKGNIKKDKFTFSELKNILSKINAVYGNEQTAFSIKNLEISGNDIKQLGVQEGPEIGKILNHLFDMVLDNPDLNNYKFLIDYTKKYLLTKKK